MIPNAKLDSGYPGDRAGGGARHLHAPADRGRQDGDRAVHPPARSRARPPPTPTSPSSSASPSASGTPSRGSPTTSLRLRAVRRQLADRNELLAKDDKAKPLIEPSQALIAKLDALEARLHNPKAEITYDVLAQKGGTQLYSRLAPFMDWSANGNGAPTQGMREVFAAQMKELDGRRSRARRAASTRISRRSTRRRPSSGCRGSTCRGSDGFSKETREWINLR